MCVLVTLSQNKVTGENNYFFLGRPQESPLRVEMEVLGINGRCVKDAVPYKYKEDLYKYTERCIVSKN